MATLANTLTFSRTQAQTDNVGLTDSNGIVFANEALTDFHRKLIASSIDASQLQEAYRDGAANTGTYLYPTDMFFLKTIELNYTDTSAINYKLATQVDVSNLSGQNSFSWLRKQASKDEPKFDDRGDWFEIFPTPTSSDNVSQLMRIFYFLKPTEYSATSDTINYPESLDYRILGWRIAASYFYSLGKMPEGDAFNTKYEEKTKDLIATLGRGAQQPIQAEALTLTGWDL